MRKRRLTDLQVREIYEEIRKGELKFHEIEKKWGLPIAYASQLNNGVIYRQTGVEYPIRVKNKKKVQNNNDTLEYIAQLEAKIESLTKLIKNQGVAAPEGFTAYPISYNGDVEVWYVSEEAMRHENAKDVARNMNLQLPSILDLILPDGSGKTRCKLLKEARCLDTVWLVDRPYGDSGTAQDVSIKTGAIATSLVGSHNRLLLKKGVE